MLRRYAPRNDVVIASPKGVAIHMQKGTVMIVITPHPTEELRLIKYQKELVRCLFTPGALVYAHQPLWIPANFESVEQAKKEIKSVNVSAPEYDEERESFICPVKIETVGGTCLESKLDFIHGLPRRSAIHINKDLFPLPLKIFRLGECTSPSPGFYELSNVVWKKLT